MTAYIFNISHYRNRRINVRNTICGVQIMDMTG